MKRLLFCLLAAMMAAGTVEARAPKYANRAEMIAAQIHDPNSKYVIVVCHRGDWRNFPENSIPAIESVIRMGADMVELDLKMTKDSVLVLSHDATINRCTTGRGRVSDYTYEELCKFRLKRGHDDDAAYLTGDCDAVYGKLLDMGVSMIQTDRPEMLIKYLKKQHRH